jgi:hypothetical protein
MKKNVGKKKENKEIQIKICKKKTCGVGKATVLSPRLLEYC